MCYHFPNLIVQSESTVDNLLICECRRVLGDADSMQWRWSLYDLHFQDNLFKLNYLFQDVLLKDNLIFYIYYLPSIYDFP